MQLLIVICFVFILLLPFTRFLLFNFPMVIGSGIKSVYLYFAHKGWNECKAYGKIIAYTGLFGQGKTKQCVRYIVGQYNQYNGRKIYDVSSDSWVTQNIVVYSNVKLSIPYVELTSMQQLVDCQNTPFGTVNLFLIDEASVVFNSREFKNNFSTPALNTILTSRHHRIGVYLTAQRFGHLDALLRQVTSVVHDCKYDPFFHVQRELVYDAWDLENCTNPQLLKPLETIYTWTPSKVYKMYDTFAMVSDISKKCTEKAAFVSDDQILQSQGTSGDYHMAGHVKRKTKKRF